MPYYGADSDILAEEQLLSRILTKLEAREYTEACVDLRERLQELKDIRESWITFEEIAEVELRSLGETYEN